MYYVYLHVLKVVVDSTSAPFGTVHGLLGHKLFEVDIGRSALMYLPTNNILIYLFIPLILTLYNQIHTFF